MTSIKEAIELLEKAYGIILHSKSINEDDFCAVKEPIAKALALLKEPKCEICGGTGKIPRKEKQHCRLRLCADLEIPSCWKCRFHIHEAPCPDCTAQEQPQAGEFARRARLIATHCPSKPRTTMEKCILELCDRLDAETQRADKAESHIIVIKKNRNEFFDKTVDLEASRKELLELCEEFMEIADDGSAEFDDPAPGSIFLRAEAIIAKEKQL